MLCLHLGRNNWARGFRQRNWQSQKNWNLWSNQVNARGIFFVDNWLSSSMISLVEHRSCHPFTRKNKTLLICSVHRTVSINSAGQVEPLPVFQIDDVSFSVLFSPFRVEFGLVLLFQSFIERIEISSRWQISRSPSNSLSACELHRVRMSSRIVDDHSLSVILLSQTNTLLLLRTDATLLCSYCIDDQHLGGIQTARRDG